MPYLILQGQEQRDTPLLYPSCFQAFISNTHVSADIIRKRVRSPLKPFNHGMYSYTAIIFGQEVSRYIERFTASSQRSQILDIGRH